MLNVAVLEKLSEHNDCPINCSSSPKIGGNRLARYKCRWCFIILDKSEPSQLRDPVYYIRNGKSRFPVVGTVHRPPSVGISRKPRPRVSLARIVPMQQGILRD